MHIEENLPGSAATGSGGVGIDDSTSIEGAEATTFAAAGDRLPVHLHRSCSSGYLGQPQTVLMHGERHTHSSHPETKLKNLNSEPGLMSEISESGE